MIFFLYKVNRLKQTIYGENMNQEQYKKIAESHNPKDGKTMNLIRAFVIGGLVGAIGELLLEIYTSYFSIPSKEASSYMIITLIFIASVLTAFGFFDNFVQFARAGLIVPITGFAHAMTSSALEYRREGFITGLGANIFKLTGSVILYGVVSAYIFGMLRILFFGG